MSTASKMTLLLIICLCADIALGAQPIGWSKDRRDSLSLNDFKYIYNRAFDLALKDARTTTDLVGVFYNPDFVKADSLIITIDPILCETCFDLKYVDTLKSLRYDAIESSQEYFDQQFVYNSGTLKYMHYEDSLNLSGNHMMHVRLSPIYESGGLFYLGIKCYYQLKTTKGITDYNTTVLFQFEICNNNHIMFRKIFVPIGLISNENVCNTKIIQDRPCY